MPDQRSIEQRLALEGLDAGSWANAPGDTYAAHSHSYDKVLVATAGAITFHISELSRDVDLRAGERLELPAGTLHAATVSSAGVRCLEAHLPAGSLSAGLRHLSDW